MFNSKENPRSKRQLWKSTIALIGLLVVGIGASSPVHAFDTGPHQDLTNEVMKEYGMNDEANRTVQLENWLTDYYSNSPTTKIPLTLDPTEGIKAKHHLEQLHFDNLPSTERITHYWGRLTGNTKLAVQDAARENNPMKLLSLMGVSLHAVQDFYTHSTWVETHPAAGADYNTVTWFDTTDRHNVRTGRYPSANKNAVNPSEDHGDYDHGINHDSQSRPRFGNAYVFAYAATRQWVSQIRDWVNEVNPGVWTAAQNISLSARDKAALNLGLESAYRISEWVTPSSDGHWKGKGSGDGPAWALATVRWLNGDGGSFVEHFRSRYFEFISGGMGSADLLEVDAPATRPVPGVTHIDIHKKVVLVRTTKIREIQNGRFESNIDFRGVPDFYALIDIDGMRFVENTYQNRSEVNHPWETFKFVDSSAGTIPVRIEVWDEDVPFKSSDDHIDILHGNGRDQDLQFNTNTQMISGTINGIFNNDNNVFREEGKERDRAAIEGFITTRTLSNPRAVREDTPQSGPNFVVNINDDGNDGVCGINDCSLREAINAANANEDSSIISFEPRAFAQQKTIVLTQGTLPDLTTNIHLYGPTTPGSGVALNDTKGSGTLDGVILRVKSKAAVIAHLTFTGGLSGVSAIGGTATISGCTFDGTYYGVYAEDQATVENCTFYSNGYGLSTGIPSAVLNANSCTITHDFNGIKVFGGSLRVQNTICAGNGTNVAGDIVNEGNNILTGTAQEAGLLTENGRAKFGHNGGPTPTIALVAGSPAIDKGATKLSIDQRGVARPQGSTPDIGAFELVPSAPSTNAVSAPFNPSAGKS